jgi:hypothetical protein
MAERQGIMIFTAVNTETGEVVSESADIIGYDNKLESPIVRDSDGKIYAVLTEVEAQS